MGKRGEKWKDNNRKIEKWKNKEKSMVNRNVKEAGWILKGEEERLLC